MASSNLQLWVTSPQDTVGLRPGDEQNVHQTRYRHVVLDQVRDHRTVYVAYLLVLKNRWGVTPCQFGSDLRHHSF